MRTSKGLWSRDFLLLWQGQAVSLAGSSLSAVALSLWIVDATGSAAALGTIMMVGSITGLALSPLAGAAADRYPRVSILVGCDLALGLLSLALAGAARGYGKNPALALGAVLLLQAGASAANAFFATAARAATSDLVPPALVPAANAATMAVLQVAGLAGKGAGGVVYRLLGAPMIFLLDGLTFFASAATESRIQVPPKPPTPTRGWRQRLRDLAADTRAGFAYVVGHPGLRILVAVNGCVAFFLDPLLVLLPFLVKDPRFLGVAGDWYGWLLGGFGLGTLGGYWLAAFLRSRTLRAGRLATGCLALGGLGFAALGVVRTPAAALCLMTGNGTLLGLFSNHVVSLVQTRVPSDMRARALGVFQTLSLCLSPVALGLSGLVAEALDRRVDVLFVACGATVAAVALGAGSRESYRAFLCGGDDPAGSAGTLPRPE
ncbi:MAG: MFS transporter [Deferrisomatales bacterium]